MTSGERVIERIEGVGGVLTLHGERIRCQLPEDAAYLLGELRAHRDEALLVLRQRKALPEQSGRNPADANRCPPYDPHAERMRAALLQISGPDYPMGLIPWLGESHPWLYHALTEWLPDELDRLWNAGASLQEFDRALDDLRDAHRYAIELYRHGESGTSASPTGSH